MGGKKAIERLERIEKEARKLLKEEGIKPTEGSLATAMLFVMQEEHLDDQETKKKLEEVTDGE